MRRFAEALIALCAVPFIFSLSFALPAVIPASGGQTKIQTAASPSGLTAAATNYLESGQGDAAGIGYSDFDEFNNVNDPLFREGSKEFLRTGFLNDEAGKAAKASSLRDAPSDTGGKTVVKKRSSPQKTKPVIKKRKTIKSLRVDPLKNKNTI